MPIDPVLLVTVAVFAVPLLIALANHLARRNLQSARDRDAEQYVRRRLEQPSRH